MVLEQGLHLTRSSHFGQWPLFTSCSLFPLACTSSCRHHALSASMKLYFYAFSFSCSLPSHSSTWFSLPVMYKLIVVEQSVDTVCVDWLLHSTHSHFVSEAFMADVMLHLHDDCFYHASLYFYSAGLCDHRSITPSYIRVSIQLVSSLHALPCSTRSNISYKLRHLLLK
jgi:hypothetical protein